MDSGLSPQDKKDLDKFIKFFALKVKSQKGASVSSIRCERSLCDCLSPRGHFEVLGVLSLWVWFYLIFLWRTPLLVTLMFLMSCV